MGERGKGRGGQMAEDERSVRSVRRRERRERRIVRLTVRRRGRSTDLCELELLESVVIAKHFLAVAIAEEAERVHGCHA